MFLGHYGLAFAAKRAAPRASLGVLTFAAQFLDELWPILLILGVEQVRIVPGLMAASPLDFVYYPFSHSLLMAIVYGIVIGGAYFLLRRYVRGAWVVGLLVVSHWFLDVPMHQADLPPLAGRIEPESRCGIVGLRWSDPGNRTDDFRGRNLVVFSRNTAPRSHRHVESVDLRRVTGYSLCGERWLAAAKRARLGMDDTHYLAIRAMGVVDRQTSLLRRSHRRADNASHFAFLTL
jgi:hypothetical protein